MAKKKSKSTRKPTTKPVVESASPEAPKYEQVLAARRDMEQAHAHVRTVSQRLRSARTDMSDFKLRDQKVAEAELAVSKARAKAALATEKFNKLKHGG